FLHAGSSDRTVFAGRITGTGGVEAFTNVLGRRVVLDNPAATNDFTGDVFIANETVLQLALASTAEQIPNAASVPFGNANSRLRLNGLAETVGTLVGTAGIIDAIGGDSTLTFGADNASGTFDGTITQGADTLNLVKTGTGTQTLGGAVGVDTVAVNA